MEEFNHAAKSLGSKMCQENNRSKSTCCSKFLHLMTFLTEINFPFCLCLNM